MPEPTWDAWAVHASRVFLMTSDAELLALSEWARLYADAGFTPTELIAATDHVALNDPPRFRADLRNALAGRVRNERKRITTATRQPEPAGCPTCDSSGRVVVPNRVLMAAGKQGTEAVYCRCRLGMWYREQAREYLRERQRPGEPTTIEMYEQDVPEWEEVFAGWKKRDEAERVADYNASRLDRTLGQIVARMRTKG